MIDLTEVEHHPAVDEIVDVLCNKTQNKDRSFFQAVTAFFLANMAANQRAKMKTLDRGEIPVNTYAIAVAGSGYGKGYSVTTFMEEIIGGFRRRFTQNTFGTIAEKNLWSIANSQAAASGSGQQEEFDKAEKDFKLLGEFPFVFDSGTAPAVKQLRDKLLMGKVGAINFQMDELGSNLEGNTEVLNVFLELYDQGITNMKLVKSTNDNKRGLQLVGKTPANMLLFGTPDKLFDGHSVEKSFRSFLEIGYARRCLFGHGLPKPKDYLEQDPEAVFDQLTTATQSSVLDKWSQHFHKLADPQMYDWTMEVKRDVGIKLIEYKMACERAAERLPEHCMVQKAEVSHRYFKALKLAGAYAFVDQSMEVEMEHLLSAILLVEESGKAFEHMLDREDNFVKLAKFIASSGKELTHPELKKHLPFFTGSQSVRNELITMATAWGYKNHIVIQKKFVDGIELFTGESLKETNLNELIISYGEHWAYNYLSERVPFDKLDTLMTAPDMHWVNHHLKGGYNDPPEGHRSEENVIEGFNTIVVDVDGGVTLETVHELLHEYTFMTYTTKRHTDDEHRFRLIIPINYELKLDKEDYRKFMDNVLEWLPFQSDEAANQRSKKWQTQEGTKFHYNLEGEVLDATPFIPRTSKNEHYQAEMKELASLDNLERWFAVRIANGNRNNQMIKFALALVDSGMTLPEVNQAVHAFNGKLNDALTSEEIENTIMVTVAKRFTKMAA